MGLRQESDPEWKRKEGKGGGSDLDGHAVSSKLFQPKSVDSGVLGLAKIGLLSSPCHARLWPGVGSVAWAHSQQWISKCSSWRPQRDTLRMGEVCKEHSHSHHRGTWQWKSGSRGPLSEVTTHSISLSLLKTYNPYMPLKQQNCHTFHDLCSSCSAVSHLLFVHSSVLQSAILWGA